MFLVHTKACLYDKYLGIDTSGESLSVANDQSTYKDMRGCWPTFYGLIEEILCYLKLTKDDVFVDLGCGTGRVVFFVAQKKIKKVIGIELDPAYFSILKANFRTLRNKRSPIELLNIDVVSFDPAESTIFYMFNPFGQSTLEALLLKIRKSLYSNPRTIRIVYYNPAFREYLDGQDWLYCKGPIANGKIYIWSNKK